MNEDKLKTVQEQTEAFVGELGSILETVKQIREDKAVIDDKKKKIIEREKALAKERSEFEDAIEKEHKAIEKEKQVDRERKEILDAREKEVEKREAKLKKILQSV